METGKLFQLQPAEGVGAHSLDSPEGIQDFPTDVENQTGAENQNFQAIMTALNNELIWKILGRCLNVSDLKCCRLVNRKFYQMVMNEAKFKDRVVLKVKTKGLTPEEFGKTEENWKNISLNFPVKHALNPSNYAWLYPLLTEVEYLSLRLHGNAPSSSTIIDFHPLLGRLLASCKKLKSLALEPDFIRSGSSRLSGGSETLENVQQLEILQPTNNRRPSRGDYDLRMQMKWMKEEFVEKLKNVKIYRSYFPRFRSNPMPDVYEPGYFRAQNDTMYLYWLSGGIYHSNRQHLESHSFYDMGNVALMGRAQDSDFMYETPALRALEVDPFQLEPGDSVVNLIIYLDHRPLLEQIYISCPYYNPGDNAVLSALIHAIAHHGGTLKKLKLLITLGNLSDWKFLSESTLRELRLEDYRVKAEENDWIRQVMANLPKTIEKLYLRGAVLEPGQKKKQKSLTAPLNKKDHFDRLDPKLVTQLSIFNAGGLVDNQVADLICKNFKMLRKFNLSEAQTDDEGFTEIAGLKGLQYLTLKRCGISDATLKRIWFLELRYLDVAGNLKTTETGMKMTMKQCPSLETVITPGRECKFTKEEGQKICPRLKFLIHSNDDDASPNQ